MVVVNLIRCIVDGKVITSNLVSAIDTMVKLALSNLYIPYFIAEYSD